MGPAPRPPRRRRSLWIVEFYRSSLGKKYVMAVTGVIGLVYVLFHMIGNLHVYEGPERFVEYAEGLRGFGEPIFSRAVLLTISRGGLVVALVLHVHAAYSLALHNRRMRPTSYQAARHYMVADYASRTMVWTGTIVLAFIVFHLLDLTFGVVTPGWEHGAVYQNFVLSLSRVPVAIFYIIANLALGLHIYHGTWSLFQSLGINNRRFNIARRYTAIAFTVVVVGGNLTFPLATMFGVVS